MKVKATKVFTKELQKNIPAYKFVLESYSVQEYGLYVDYDIHANISDFNDKTGKLQAIKVIYPDEYYATPQYLTTRRLNKIFRNSDGTYTGFFEAIKREIEV